MKKFYISFFAACMLLVTSLMAQPWWGNNILNIQITAGNGYSDQCIVYFIQGASTQYDAFYDAQKLPGGLDRPLIYSLKSYQDLQTLGVNGLPPITSDYMVPLGFRPGFNGNHTIIFADSGSFVAPMVVYLEDMFLQTFTNITANPVYNFTATTTDSPNARFRLHFMAPVVTSSTNATCSSLGSIQIGPGGSEHWQSYSLTAQPSGSSVASGNYTLPVNINNLAAGQYQLTLTNPYGLTYSQSFTIAGNNTNPIVGSVVSINSPDCPGDLGSATVSATGGAGNLTYTWNTNPVQTGTTATMLTSGFYQVVVSDGSACTDTIAITVNSAPIINVSLTVDNDSVYVDSLLNFLVSVNGADTLVWDFGDGTILATDQSALSHSFDDAGTYYITVTTIDGCNISDTVAVVVTNNIPDAIDEVAVDKAIVTLGSGKLNVYYNSPGKLNISIYNVTGQLTDSFAGIESSNGLYSVNTKNVSAGIYYVRISNGTNTFTKKVGVMN